jgi:hypothetical protein
MSASFSVLPLDYLVTSCPHGKHPTGDLWPTPRNESDASDFPRTIAGHTAALSGDRSRRLSSYHRTLATVCFRVTARQPAATAMGVSLPLAVLGTAGHSPPGSRPLSTICKRLRGAQSRRFEDAIGHWAISTIENYEPDTQISRIRLSDKTPRLHPRHVVPKCDA